MKVTREVETLHPSTCIKTDVFTGGEETDVQAKRKVQD
jgi:hypothetical protein